VFEGVGKIHVKKCPNIQKWVTIGMVWYCDIAIYYQDISKNDCVFGKKSTNLNFQIFLNLEDIFIVFSSVSEFIWTIFDKTRIATTLNLSNELRT
jgi:hypothetical protein